MSMYRHTLSLQVRLLAAVLERPNTIRIGLIASHTVEHVIRPQQEQCWMDAG